METENIYRHLTDLEWNTILDFTYDAKCDEVFDIHSDVNGDYFYDFENHCKIPFEEGLYLMSWDIFDVGVIYADKSRAGQREVIGQIFEKYCQDENVKNYVLTVNEKLKKKFKN